MADYPDFRIEAFLDTQPFRPLADREHFAEGYRKAGLPGMTAFVALLRAVNVGGTGKLPMSELKAMCEAPASGGAHVHRQRQRRVRRAATGSRGEEEAGAQLHDYAGKPVGVLVAARPRWPRCGRQSFSGNRQPRGGDLPRRARRRPTRWTTSSTEGGEAGLGKREIYVHYGDGMADCDWRSPPRRPAPRATSTPSPSWPRWQRRAERASGGGGMATASEYLLGQTGHEGQGCAGRPP